MSIPDPARERAAIQAQSQIDEAVKSIVRREAEIRSWFVGWFVPPDEAIHELFRITHKVRQDIEGQAGLPKLAPWEKAVEVLLRDLDDVIAGARAKLDYDTADHLVTLRRAAMLVSIHALKPRTASNAGWYRYGLEILKSIYSTAHRATGSVPSISHKDAKAIIITRKALAACGYHVEADAMVKEFRRKKATEGAVGWSIASQQIQKTSHDSGCVLKAKTPKKIIKSES